MLSDAWLADVYALLHRKLQRLSCYGACQVIEEIQSQRKGIRALIAEVQELNDQPGSQFLVSTFSVLNRLNALLPDEDPDDPEHPEDF